ncbi:MAG: hypothetical protein JJ911_19345 [Rhizobiaceae bacterium]|nr:hypothetical protein [Rhizobiaceae bacterium]
MKQLDDTFKDSFLRALDEERFDDLVLMLANLLRARQGVVGEHARASLPVDQTVCQPLVSDRLTHQEIDAFDLRDTGWYIVAVQSGRIVGAEPFPVTAEDPDYGDRIEDYARSVADYYGAEPLIYAARLDGDRLKDFAPLSEVPSECRQD